MITGVMLSWKRPENVKRILAGWRKDPMIDEAIVWNNNSEISIPNMPEAKVINARVDFGLFTRFMAGMLAKNDCVLIHDDDLQVPPDSVRSLHERWRKAPDCLHGIYGRRPDKNNFYAKLITQGRVPITLTRALLTHKQYFPFFFTAIPKFEHLMKDSKPYGNGEDIVYSYVVQKCNGGKEHYTHKLPVKKLPAPHPISARGAGRREHMRHRTRVMRACQDWLAGKLE